ncbi:MAG: hypothetical protein R3244_05690 [Thermoanaerobaculia bacterium]|nr:hypothetical protein [Thermoanaerobaculia bacterium]
MAPTRIPVRLWSRQPRWALSLLLLAGGLLGGFGTAGAASAEAPPALVIAEGSVARRQVVALGRDLVVDGEALTDVAAIDGSIRVTGRVEGDVIVLGGDAELAATAHVVGDVFVLGGTLGTRPGARIDGRAVSHPTFSAAWLTLLEGPALAETATSAVVLGAKLALLAAWLVVGFVLLAVSGREVRRTSERVRSEPFHAFWVGLTGVLAMFLTALLFSAFAAVVIGLPLLALVVLVALLLKLWGLVAVFHAVGAWIGMRFGRRLAPVECLLAGLAVLGLVKLVPYVGLWVWTVATLIGVGATLRTKFGRLEPWFQEGASARPLPAP